MRKIQFKTRTHTMEGVKKYFDLFFLPPQLNLGSSMLSIPLVKF
jgi:hypothetical protein